MSYEIICPYCFEKMKDDEVLFRSEKVNQGENSILPEDYYSIQDFMARYRLSDKESILEKLREWEFFEESQDPVYEDFWQKFSGTTENNPADDLLRVKSYNRRIIDPHNAQHQKYLKMQADGTYFIRDEQGMATQIELKTNEKCNRRVCRHCHNPLPDNYGKNPVKFAAIIGITGAGKTIYLSQLLRKMKSYCVKAGLSAIVNNAGVRVFLQNNGIKAKRALPGSTAANRFQQPLFYEMIKENEGSSHITETFVLYDVAGEVFKDPSLVKKFAPFIENADGVVMLIDPMQFDVVSGASAGGAALDQPATVLDIIHNIVSHGISDSKCPIPFAVCISKIDTSNVQEVLSDDLRRMLLDDVHGDPDGSGFNRPVFNAREYAPIAKELNKFIQTHELDLAQQMKAQYSTYAFFAFTALGCDVREGQRENGSKYQYPVGPVLPKRIEEPILWMFHELGYIGTNGVIPYPNRKIVRCPMCNSQNTVELPEDQRTVTTGYWPFKKTKKVNRMCNECGEKWEYKGE